MAENYDANDASIRGISTGTFIKGWRMTNPTESEDKIMEHFYKFDKN